MIPGKLIEFLKEGLVIEKVCVKGDARRNTHGTDGGGENQDVNIHDDDDNNFRG